MCFETFLQVTLNVAIRYEIWTYLSLIVYYLYNDRGVCQGELWSLLLNKCKWVLTSPELGH
jgi:hypothetical protein